MAPPRWPKWALREPALILPQSILLGATFPLMSAGVLRLNPSRPGRSLALLYPNSLGAAAGVLMASYYLVDLAGLPGTLVTAAMLNLAVGVLTIGASTLRRQADRIPEGMPLPTDAPRTAETAGLARLLLGVAFGTAVASFIYEIAGSGCCRWCWGSATHSFELMLSAFILGVASTTGESFGRILFGSSETTTRRFAPSAKPDARSAKRSTRLRRAGRRSSRPRRCRGSCR